eukprot:350460-Chlamydomonas_euryale.AAC.3
MLPAAHPHVQYLLASRVTHKHCSLLTSMTHERYWSASMSTPSSRMARMAFSAVDSCPFDCKGRDTARRAPVKSCTFGKSTRSVIRLPACPPARLPARLPHTRLPPPGRCRLPVTIRPPPGRPPASLPATYPSARPCPPASLPATYPSARPCAPACSAHCDKSLKPFAHPSTHPRRSACPAALSFTSLAPSPPLHMHRASHQAESNKPLTCLRMHARTCARARIHACPHAVHIAEPNNRVCHLPVGLPAHVQEGAECNQQRTQLPPPVVALHEGGVRLCGRRQTVRARITRRVGGRGLGVRHRVAPRRDVHTLVVRPLIGLGVCARAELVRQLGRLGQPVITFERLGSRRQLHRIGREPCVPRAL